jgi:hypothetical protein
MAFMKFSRNHRDAHLPCRRRAPDVIRLQRHDAEETQVVRRSEDVLVAADADHCTGGRG